MWYLTKHAHLMSMLGCTVSTVEYSPLAYRGLLVLVFYRWWLLLIQQQEGGAGAQQLDLLQGVPLLLTIHM